MKYKMPVSQYVTQRLLTTAFAVCEMWKCERCLPVTNVTFEQKFNSLVKLTPK